MFGFVPSRAVHAWFCFIASRAIQFLPTENLCFCPLPQARVLPCAGLRFACRLAESLGCLDQRGQVCGELRFGLLGSGSHMDGFLPVSQNGGLIRVRVLSWLELTHQSFNPLGFSSGHIFEGFRQAFDALRHVASDKPSMLRAISRQNPGGTVFFLLFF